MERTEQVGTSGARGFPHVLPMRERAELIERLLRERLETVLPRAMRESGIDLWLILCQEDNPDPVYTTVIPMDTWSPILSILLFHDGGADAGVRRINISGTDTHELYERPYRGQVESEQWSALLEIVERLDPRRIGINIGSIAWAAGGLTYNLYRQLCERLPRRYLERLVSAEPLATRWLATLTDGEIDTYGHVVSVAHALIAECFSPAVIEPGVSTVDDLAWHYWQRCADLGLEVSFKPFFGITRPLGGSQTGPQERLIRPGDLLRCDVGIRYLRLNTDHQQAAYVRRPGEREAPRGLQRLLGECGRLQELFMASFRRGLTGNELLADILRRARAEGVPSPRVYSHSLGLFLHEPGPLIGLPWEQEACPGRGEVRLEENEAFTMELSVEAGVPEWGGQSVRLACEEDVVFSEGACSPIGGRQRAFHLI